MGLSTVHWMIPLALLFIGIGETLFLPSSGGALVLGMGEARWVPHLMTLFILSPSQVQFGLSLEDFCSECFRKYKVTDWRCDARKREAPLFTLSKYFNKHVSKFCWFIAGESTVYLCWRGLKLGKVFACVDYYVPCEALIASTLKKAKQKRWRKGLKILMNLGWASGKWWGATVRSQCQEWRAKKRLKVDNVQW